MVKVIFWVAFGKLKSTVLWTLLQRERVGRFGRTALKRLISCMKRVASPGSMHDTEYLGLVHWDDSEGWYGEGGGRRVQDEIGRAHV